MKTVQFQERQAGILDSFIGMVPYVLLSGLISVMIARNPILGLACPLLFLVLWPLVRRRYDLIIYFLIVYFTFENFAIKYLPPEGVLLSKVLPEFILYAALGSQLIYRWYHREPLVRTPIDLAMFLLLALGIASVIVNQVPVKMGIVDLRLMFRYATAFYLVAYSDLPKGVAKGIVLCVLVMGATQIAIGMAQLIIGEEAFWFFRGSGRYMDVGNLKVHYYAWQPVGMGSRIFGTLGRFEFLGYFMLLVIFFWIALYLFRILRGRIVFAVGLILGVFTIVKTFSRISILALIAGLGTYYLFTKRRVFILVPVIGAIVLVAGVAFINPDTAAVKMWQEEGTIFHKLSAAFHMSQYDPYAYGRSYALLVGKRVLMETPLLGVGPGAFGRWFPDSEDYKAPFLKLNVRMTSLAEEIITMGWAFLFSEYGLAGLLALLFIMVRLFILSWTTFRATSDNFLKSLCMGYAAYVVALFLITFVNFIFHYRFGPFYFWLLGGLVFSLGRKEATV